MFRKLYGIPLLLIYAGIGQIIVSETNGARLNDFIRHYEVLDYDQLDLQQKHLRVKRWANENTNHDFDAGTLYNEPRIHLKFSAHARDFHLRLKRDTSVFGDGFSLKIGQKNSVAFAQNMHLFEGDVSGFPGSQVYGSIQDGIFDGKITLSPKEVYYVENSQKFSLPSRNQSQHSLIYAERDVDNSALSGRNPDGPTDTHKHCGVDDHTLRWMKNVQGSKLKNNADDAESYFHSVSNFHSHNASFENGAYSLAHEIIRHKRNTNSKLRTTCNLHIRTDPTLWKYISKMNSGKEKHKIREELLSIIGQHVKEANNIFSNTQFTGRRVHQGIQFVVRTVEIDSDEECEPGFNGTLNPFCAENIDVSNFLDLHSRTNYDAYCLSYVFTYRDFTGGVVGLAWVASSALTGAAGGICEKYTKYREGTSMKHRSLNTGLVTFLNYNRLVPPRVSHLAFAHEVGHNFGASHDEEAKCQTSGKDGNYLMYASSTSGYLPNNARFSQCSIDSIAAVLDRIVAEEGARKNCFETSEGAFCGNQIVETGEECDCGYSSKDCSDVDGSCCSPRTLNGRDANSMSCRLTPGSTCSPTQGPCCAQDCQYASGILCRPETECAQESACDGRGSICPVPEFKANKTLCNEGTQVCISGECRGSICLKYGLEECYLSSVDYPDKSTLCKVACLNTGGKCVSTAELDISELADGLKLPPGSPCDNFQGYCDVFSKCRAVDEKGPLLRIKRLLFNKGNFKTIAEWARAKWWQAVLVGTVLIILMGVFIKCCAVHTPSSNPNLPANLKFAHTLRHPVETLKRRPKQGTAEEFEMRRLNVNPAGPSRGGRRKPNPKSRGQRFDEERDPFH